jgi:hypothetical protein
VREPSAQHAKDLVHLVHAEGGLRGDSEWDAFGRLHLLGFLEVVDERDMLRRVPRTALRLHMPAVPDIQDVIALPREAGNLAMHLAHQRAGRVDDIQSAFLRLLTHGRRDPMRAEHHIRARRNIVQVFHEDHAALFERAHHMLVMHNRVAHIQGRAERLQREIDHLDGIRDACAEPARRRQQHFLHRPEVYLIRAYFVRSDAECAKNGV